MLVQRRRHSISCQSGYPSLVCLAKWPLSGQRASFSHKTVFQVKLGNYVGLSKSRVATLPHRPLLALMLLLEAWGIPFDCHCLDFSLQHDAVLSLMVPGHLLKWSKFFVQQHLLIPSRCTSSYHQGRSEHNTQHYSVRFQLRLLNWAFRQSLHVSTCLSL